MWWIVILIGLGLVVAMVVGLVRRPKGTPKDGPPEFSERQDRKYDADRAPGGGFGGMGGL